MVKAGKRSSVGAAAFPVMVIPKKTDHQLQSLMDFGDNLEVSYLSYTTNVVLHRPLPIMGSCVVLDVSVALRI